MTKTAGQVFDDQLDLMTPDLLARLTGDTSTGGHIRVRSTRDLIAIGAAGTGALTLSTLALTSPGLRGDHAAALWFTLLLGALVLAYVPFARRIDRFNHRNYGLHILGLALLRTGALADEEETLQLCRKAHVEHVRDPLRWNIRSEIIRDRVLHTLLIHGDRSTLAHAQLLRRGPEATRTA